MTGDQLQQTLLLGEFELQGQFVLGSNYTFLVSVRHEGHELQAVYKPSKGEQPLWDFPEQTLAQREVAAWHVSRSLGWDCVPLTVLRADGPFGPGSLQQYIDYNPNYHYFTFTTEDRERLRPVALFDALVNNADRKGSHVLVQKRTRKLWLIDHGLCFHVEDKLRTVIWDFSGLPVPADLLGSLDRLRADLAGPLRPALAGLLAPDEILALDARAAALLAAPRFPDPPRDRRAFPYPPI